MLKILLTLLGIGLAAMMSTDVSAHECGHAWERGWDYGVHFDRRMSALHSALKLTASQEPAWTEFSSKMKPVKMGKPEYRDWENLSAPDRLDRMTEEMKSHEKTMSEHATIVRTFYDTLDQEQKKIFDQHFQGRHHRHHHMPAVNN